MSKGTGTIPVYVQTAEEDPTYFTDWDAGDLTSVFTLLRSWGLVDSDGTQLDVSQAAGDLLMHEGRTVFRVSVIDAE